MLENLAMPDKGFVHILGVNGLMNSFFQTFTNCLLHYYYIIIYLLLCLEVDLKTNKPKELKFKEQIIVLIFQEKTRCLHQNISEYIE